MNGSSSALCTLWAPPTAGGEITDVHYPHPTPIPPLPHTTNSDQISYMLSITKHLAPARSSCSNSKNRKSAYTLSPTTGPAPISLT